jgi:GH15 family glucan-1,4-alpha-glucosidase
MAYLPIDEHGIIGNLRSVALVGTDGAIDWCCAPRVDSPSIFASILDDERGGVFRICPRLDDVRTRQMYLPDTNVLVTRFLHPDGVAELVDFMALSVHPDGARSPWRIVRTATAVRGAVPFRLNCRPAFDYGRARHETKPREDGVLFHIDGLALALTSTVPLRIEDNGATAEFLLEAGKKVSFVLEAAGDPGPLGAALSDAAVETLFLDTAAFWRRWLARSTYVGRWREMVNRSALVLKLLTYAPTGAMVAAATTSLPERLGGARNWDYRYTWIRDSSFTLFALLRLGFTEEAADFMRWVEARCQEIKPDGSLQPVYRVDGSHDLAEAVLTHLRGYRGAQPVRIGNEAYRQLQLDIYGELVDAAYLYNKHVAPVASEMWANVVTLLDWLGRNWQASDNGIWEIRGEPRQFVHSRLMCWVAFERAMRIARARGLPAPYEQWRHHRDAIYQEIMDKGWDHGARSFTQYYGGSSPDASLLLMSLVKFMGPTDPRLLATLERIQRELVTDSLVHRYDPTLAAPDGLEGAEGTFSACSFWWVDGLTGARRFDEARLTFEKMLTYANHVGLYAEQIGLSGEALGNFPQALTHLALIGAATNLDRALDGSA